MRLGNCKCGRPLYPRYGIYHFHYTESYCKARKAINFWQHDQPKILSLKWIPVETLAGKRL